SNGKKKTPGSIAGPGRLITDCSLRERYGMVMTADRMLAVFAVSVTDNVAVPAVLPLRWRMMVQVRLATGAVASVLPVQSSMVLVIDPALVPLRVTVSGPGVPGLVTGSSVTVNVWVAPTVARLAVAGPRVNDGTETAASVTVTGVPPLTFAALMFSVADSVPIAAGVRTTSSWH